MTLETISTVACAHLRGCGLQESGGEADCDGDLVRQGRLNVPKDPDWYCENNHFEGTIGGCEADPARNLCSYRQSKVTSADKRASSQNRCRFCQRERKTRQSRIGHRLLPSLLSSKLPKAR